MIRKQKPTLPENRKQRMLKIVQENNQPSENRFYPAGRQDQNTLHSGLALKCQAEFTSKSKVPLNLHSVTNVTYSQLLEVQHQKSTVCDSELCHLIKFVHLTPKSWCHSGNPFSKLETTSARHFQALKKYLEVFF